MMARLSKTCLFSSRTCGSIKRTCIHDGFAVTCRRSMTTTISSVSTLEVAKFSALASTWWDPRENPLIGMNVIRMKYIEDQVAAKKNTSSFNEGRRVNDLPLSGLKALDVGCGGGLLSESLARRGALVTAIDPSRALVDAARHHSQLDPKTRSIDFRGGTSIEELASQFNNVEKDDADLFDVICLLEVLEHVDDPDSMLSSIHTLLKPNGQLFLSTLNQTMKSKLIAIWGAEYLLRYLPIGTHDWSQFRSPTQVQELLDGHGFVPVHVSGMVMTSPVGLLWNGQWDWKLDEKDVDVNWIGTYKKKQPTTDR